MAGLTPEEIREIAKQQARYNSLVAENADEQRSIRDLILDQTNQLKFQQTLKQDIRKATNDIYRLEYDLRTENDRALGTRQAQLSIDKDIQKVIKANNSLEQDANALRKEGTESAIELANNIEEQRKRGAALLKTLESQAKTSKEIRNSFGVTLFQGLSEGFQKIGGKASQLAGPFEAMAEASREVVEEGVKNNNKISERQGILDKIRKGQLKANKENLEGIEIIGKKGKALYGGAAKEALKSGKANIKNIGAPISKFRLGLKGLGAGFKALAPMIKSALGPIGLIITAVQAIASIVKAMFAASKATADMSRNMLISREAARELYSETIPGVVGQFNEISKEAGNVTITFAAYEKALASINEQLGLQLNLTEDFGKQTAMNVAEVARMTENFGYSVKASKELFFEATKTGKPLEQLNKEIFGAVGNLAAATGIVPDFVKLTEKAANIGGNLKANFGGSVAELTQAVFKAQLMGLELEQMNGISNSLLSFQSSIQNELEAELLLGRQLNLEKAREAALMGDTETLMKEINQQVGSQKDFLKLNIIQRQKLAQAVGMEVNELADMFDKQAKMDALRKKNLKVQNKLKEAGLNIDDKNFDIQKASLQEIRAAAINAGKSEAELRDILGDQIYLRKQEEDASQKFKKAMDQLREVFTRFIDGGFLDKVAEIIQGLTEGPLFDQYTKKLDEEEQQQAISKIQPDKFEQAGVTEKEYAKLLEKANLTKGLFGLTSDFAFATNAGIQEARDKLKEIEKTFKNPPQTSTNVSTNDAKSTVTPTEGVLRDKYVEDRKSALQSKSQSIDVDDFQIRTNPADTLVMAGGTRFGEETNALLKELLTAVKSGGDVYIDGSKVGKSLQLASSRMG